MPENLHITLLTPTIPIIAMLLTTACTHYQYYMRVIDNQSEMAKLAILFGIWRKGSLKTCAWRKKFPTGLSMLTGG